MIIKQMFFRIFFFNLNNKIFLLNNINFKNILFLKKVKNIFLISSPNNFKYSWSELNTNNNDFFLNIIIPKNNVFKFLISKNFDNHNCLFKNIVMMKKKFSVIKKNIDTTLITINKVHENKNYFLKTFYNDSFFSKQEKNFEINFDNFNKNLDLKNKTKALFKKNRIFIKGLFNLKYYRKFVLSRHLKNISNLKKKDFIFNVEYKIVNVLMNCDFFFSSYDCLWFLKNNLILVNSKIVKSVNLVIKKSDIIQIVNSKYYYNFYKLFFNDLLINIYKINVKFWSFNKSKNSNIDLKDKKNKYPKWIDYYKFFKKDIPLNFEIDYISMTIIFLEYNINNINYFDFKFINLHLNRLYNWKFII